MSLDRIDVIISKGCRRTIKKQKMAFLQGFDAYTCAIHKATNLEDAGEAALLAHGKAASSAPVPAPVQADDSDEDDFTPIQ